MRNTYDSTKCHTKHTREKARKKESKKPAQITHFAIQYHNYYMRYAHVMVC